MPFPPVTGLILSFSRSAATLSNFGLFVLKTFSSLLLSSSCYSSQRSPLISRIFKATGLYRLLVGTAGEREWKLGGCLLIWALLVLAWPLIRCLAVVCLLMVFTERSLVNRHGKGKRVTGDCALYTTGFFHGSLLEAVFSSSIHLFVNLPSVSIHLCIYLVVILTTVSSSWIVTLCSE